MQRRRHRLGVANQPDRFPDRGPPQPSRQRADLLRTIREALAADRRQPHTATASSSTQALLVALELRRKLYIDPAGVEVEVIPPGHEIELDLRWGDTDRVYLVPELAQGFPGVL
jgi:hypothetical protein